MIVAVTVIKKLEEDRENGQFEIFWEDIIKNLTRNVQLPKNSDEPEAQ